MGVWTVTGTTNSVVGASICSAVFFLAAIGNVIMFRRTNFRLHAIMGLGGFFRGIGFALTAAASSAQDASTGSGIVYGFFTAAGLGIAIALTCLMAVVWFNNSRDSVRPPGYQIFSILMKLLFPLVIILGPILGLAMAALIYSNSFPLPQNVIDGEGADDKDLLLDDPLTLLFAYPSASLGIRKTSSMGMMLIAAIVTAASFGLSIFVALKKEGGGFKDPDALIWYLGFSTIFLVWSGGFRVACAYTYYPTLAVNETLFFTLSILPEMINIILWLVPDRLMIRSVLGSGFDDWWAKNHPASSPTKALPDNDKKLSDIEVPEIVPVEEVSL